MAMCYYIYQYVLSVFKYDLHVYVLCKVSSHFVCLNFFFFFFSINLYIYRRFILAKKFNRPLSF